MTSRLALVPPPSESLADVIAAHDRRSQWLDSLAPDRSRFKGSAGVQALKALKPLAHDEQAHRDRCEEKTRLAKVEDRSLLSLVAQCFAIGRER